MAYTPTGDRNFIAAMKRMSTSSGSAPMFPPARSCPSPSAANPSFPATPRSTAQSGLSARTQTTK
jgi:hypothetical protein